MEQSAGRDPSGVQENAGAALTAVLISASLFAIAAAFWFYRIRGYYFPAGDEFALLVHSARFFHPAPSDWFLHGFEDYFRPYPDISLPYSNFLRPVANATYYFDSLIFGKHWGAYLLTNYAIVACVVGAVYYLCRGLLGVPLAISCLVAAATATSPAIVWQLVYTPSFAFDYLGGLWVMLQIIFLIRRRYFVAWVLLWLAVFTKEPTIYAGAAGCLAIFFTHRDASSTRRSALAGSYLLPIAVLFALRWYDFRGATGAYVVSGITLRSTMKNVVLGVLRWPYKVPWAQRVFDISLANAFSLIVSAFGWAIVLAAAYYFIIPFLLVRNQGASAADFQESAGTDQARQIVNVFFVCSLVMPVMLSLAPRFGASVFPLFFISMACVLARPGMSGFIRSGTAVFFAIVLCLNIVQLAETLSPQVAAKEQAKWALSRSLIERLSTDNSPVDFLVGDYAEDFASPEWVKRFSGYIGDLVPVSNVDLSGCAVAPAIDVTVIRETYQFRSKLDAGCGNNALFGAYRVDRLSGMTLMRDLPEAEISYTAADRPREKVEFATQDLTVVIHAKVSRYVVLIPDSAGGPHIRVLDGNVSH